MIDGKTFGWVYHFIISTREEKQVSLSNHIHLKLNPWTDQEMNHYVDSFFQGQKPEREQNARKILQRVRKERKAKEGTGKKRQKRWKKRRKEIMLKKRKNRKGTKRQKERKEMERKEFLPSLIKIDSFFF